MPVFIIIIGIIVGWIGILYLISRYSTIIFEFERGLKYRKGKFVEVLGPGRYWIFSRSSTISKIDVRPKARRPPCPYPILREAGSHKLFFRIVFRFVGVLDKTP